MGLELSKFGRRRQVGQLVAYAYRANAFCDVVYDDYGAAPKCY